MNRAMFSIVLLAALAHSCVAEIVMKTAGPQDLKRLYEAAVDVAMTCYGDPGHAVGIIGDTDGSIQEELQLKHFIPVVLINGSNYRTGRGDFARLHELRVFIIAVHSPMYFNCLLFELRQSIWYNNYANFLIVDMRNEVKNVQCTSVKWFMFTVTQNGLLNVQFICLFYEPDVNEVLIWNSNPFTHRAPNFWRFFEEFNFKSSEDERNHFLFVRFYQEGGQSCESINFDKTRNVDGYPLRFVVNLPPTYLERDSVFSKGGWTSRTSIVAKWSFDEHRWFIDNIVTAMNVSAVISDELKPPGILLLPLYLSSQITTLRNRRIGIIINLREVPIFAVTQHTPHMSQLDKILSVIDRNSRIGMWLVYLITFLFFKFFLGQPVIPALLNLVRLTCNTGLTKLPRNVAPTLYLTSLLMFVVTLQAIYTGNLATLLTTTIPYPNVQTRQDIPKRDYKMYTSEGDHTKLTADPILQGCVIEIPRLNNCIEYVLRDPLAVCIMPYNRAIIEADKWKLHISRYPILHEYTLYAISKPNLFERRIQEVLTTLFESGLHNSDIALERLRLQFVDDDEVKKNTERRVMTIDDLRFDFVILGVGLLCSIICFIGEIVMWRIRLKYAKRRKRLRGRYAWEVNVNHFFSFPSLNCLFNLRLLFSNRR